MHKYTPTDEQLLNILPHIHHEISQVVEALWASASIRDDLPSNACPAQLEYILWGACLIHVRILLDFFEFEKRRIRYDREMDDVLSSDFGFQTQKVDITSRYRDRINKDLAHLTYSKADRAFNDNLLPITRIFFPLMQRCAQFSEHLLSSSLMDHAPQYLLAWETLLERINSLAELITRNENRSGTIPV